jgi:hypothetical protein
MDVAGGNETPTRIELDHVRTKADHHEYETCFAEKVDRYSFNLIEDSSADPLTLERGPDGEQSEVGTAAVS